MFRALAINERKQECHNVTIVYSVCYLSYLIFIYLKPDKVGKYIDTLFQSLSLLSIQDLVT